MSMERRSCVSSEPHVNKRLYAVLVVLIGLICIFGGYLLGRMARNEVKRNKILLTYNLTVSADTLYKKSKRITPKVIHNTGSDSIKAKLFDIFNCNDCGTINKYNLADYVRNSINYQVLKLMRSLHNATVYLDSLS